MAEYFADDEIKKDAFLNRKASGRHSILQIQLIYCCQSLKFKPRAELENARA
jgi:hypothetical protein